MKLKEGRRYNFNVEKIISLNDIDYYVLSGPDKRKYLLDIEDYTSYNIEPGMQLDCRVDKINCQGEIFLEPRHPYYEEGKSYSFNVNNYEDRVDKSGSNVEVVILKDEYLLEVVVPITEFGENLPAHGESVSVVVDRIFKGAIKVSGNPVKEKVQKDEESSVYTFILYGESLGIDGKNYYLVKNENGETFTLPVEYYKHYKLEIGAGFEGRYIRYKEEAEISVEPINPDYEPGGEYLFIVKDIVFVADGIAYLNVIDKQGMIHKTDYRSEFSQGQEIYCKVERIRKGWPLLTVL